MLKSLVAVLLALGAISPIGAQTGDNDLASYYLDAGEYDKAKLYYEKLYDANPNTANYKGLLRSYLELGEYKDAERHVKRHMKKYASSVYYIDLGEVYEAQEDFKDAEKAYREAIRSLPKSQGLIIRTANEFIRRNKLDLALETYLHGKSILEDRYPFSYEIAGLYGTMGDNERMIEEYLNLLDFNEAYLQTIQNALNRSIDFETDDDGVELIRRELLKRVQNQPQSTIYAEMLTWFFLQRREFRSALIQLEALDKRLNEDGRRLLTFAGLCVNNEAYEVAADAYDYIASKGKENPYYAYARSGALKADFESLRRTYPLDTAELNRLHDRYAATLAELGRSNETMGLMRQRANLEAYYLGDLLAANNTLNAALEVPGIHEEQRAEVKLALAQILIARDYIWDASLLASQVDKDFKNDVIGHRAKFLNAKISYYAGDFQWAQAQLDILKGSTSKLISNDAMDLSLLISDNLNLDTITEPMMMYARADLLAIQRRFDDAQTVLDSIAIQYPGHALEDESLMLKARMAESQHRYENALELYQAVLSDYYFDIHADNALFRMAEIQDDIFDRPEVAADLYKQLMVDFPGSLFVVEARKRFRRIRGDDVNTEAPRILPDKVP